MNTNKVIFVVDDDASIREVVEIILSEKGYTVVTIKNEDGLFKQLKKQIPQLIFLDFQISGADGISITRKIKKDVATKGVPVVILSAMPNLKVLVKEAGADDYLEKPFEIDRLLTMASRYL